MTSILMAVLAALAAAAPADYDHTHGQLDMVLKQHVRDGLVNYAALKGERAALDAYLKTAGGVPMATFQSWSKDEQLAFLINLYNATTLQVIVDAYPVDSIKSLGSLLSSPWEKETVLLFGKRVSLDTLEHKIIRKNYAEPRIHFALVCAAMGCPPLRAEAYAGAKLDEQLDSQTRTFLTTPEKNRADIAEKKLLLSPIFKWYRDDFETGSQSLAAFVAPYMSGADSQADLECFDIAFTDYDWSLNDRPESR